MKKFGASSISLTFCLSLTVITARAQQAPVNLRSASSFAALAATTVTVTGAGAITGNIGIFPNTAYVAGTPPVTVNGTVYAGGPVAAQAQADLTTAFNDAAGRSVGAITVAGNIGGQTLAPGLYTSTSSLAISSGDLTLDAQGNANAVWIFQIASTLTTTSGRQVVLAGGANAANVFWQVGSSATIGTTSVFQGTILAAVSITMATGSTLAGRALAMGGAVTIDTGGGSSATIPVAFSPCDVNQDGTTNGIDAQGMVNEALGARSPANDLNADGVVNVVDIQIDLNAVLKLGCSASAATDAPAITAVVNAANLRSGPIAPGEVVAIFGGGLGSARVQVLFDGTPAPLTYVSPARIDCVAPYEMSGKGRTEIQVRYQDRASIPFPLDTAAANPAIFTTAGSGTGPAAVLNQDQSANSPENPAARGSIVVLFITGEGQTSPPGMTGKITAMSDRTPQPLLPIAVLFDGQPVSVTFYGEAPGVISGVMQLSVRIPSTVPSGEIPISVSVGGNRSQNDVTVSVRER